LADGEAVIFNSLIVPTSLAQIKHITVSKGRKSRGGTNHPGEERLAVPLTAAGPAPTASPDWPGPAWQYQPGR